MEAIITKYSYAIQCEGCCNILDEGDLHLDITVGTERDSTSIPFCEECYMQIFAEITEHIVDADQRSSREGIADR